MNLPFVLNYSYGIELNNGGTSNDGYMKCKINGTYVGKCVHASPFLTYS